MTALLLALLLTDAPDRLRPSALPNDAALAQLLWERAPDLQLQRVKVAQARADQQRAGFLPNPTLDVSANTLPVGPTNPAQLDDPFGNVPNYAFALSAPIELGKRGPRQLATRRAFEAAVFDARESLRQRFADLQERLGEIASTQVRIEALTSLTKDASRLTAIQKTRSDKGDVSALDSDRALLEEEKLAATLGEETDKLISALRACAEVSGVPCEPFESPESAARFLSRPFTANSSALELRSDLQSLDAQTKSAQAYETLARRRGIPDPTVRVGYVRDQFLTAGNQQNSLFVGLSIPLPVFDHGQADAEASAVAARATTRAREQTLALAQQTLSSLAHQWREVESRRALVREKALPLAKNIVDRLDAAVQRAGGSLQDLLLARRTLGELTLDSSDLDLAAFRLSVTQVRASGVTLEMPSEISPPQESP